MNSFITIGLREVNLKIKEKKEICLFCSPYIRRAIDERARYRRRVRIGGHARRRRNSKSRACVYFVRAFVSRRKKGLLTVKNLSKRNNYV